MYPLTALVYVKHARTYHQTPELGRFKAFHFYDCWALGPGPQDPTGRGIRVEAKVGGSPRTQPGFRARLDPEGSSGGS